MNGAFFPKTRSKAFPTDGTQTDAVKKAWEVLILTGSGALAVVLHQSFQLPLGLPGHHGIEWMALLIMGSSFSRMKGSATISSLGAAGMSLLPIWGVQNDPFIWLIYFLPGPVIDLALHFLPGYAKKFWFLSILAGLAHTTKPVFRLIITVLSGWSFGSFRFGVLYPVSSHFMYGMIGGLLGAMIALGIQRVSKKKQE